MSALLIIECNNCGERSPYARSTIDLVRHDAAPDGWAVDVTGDNIDYCPRCTAPAAAADPYAVPGPFGTTAPPPNRIDVARSGIEQLRDALAGITAMVDYRPSVVVSVANLARIRADQLLTELAS